MRGGTSYVAAFRMLRSVIEQDVKQLKADGFAVHRPAVFFFSATASRPTTTAPGSRRSRSSRATTAETQTGFAYWPNVIPFGVGARPDTLRELIHPRQRSKAYFMKDGAKPDQVIRQMAEVLIASTMASGSSFGNGGPGLVLPDDASLGGEIVAADYEDLL